MLAQITANPASPVSRMMASSTDIRFSQALLGALTSARETCFAESPGEKVDDPKFTGPVGEIGAIQSGAIPRRTATSTGLAATSKVRCKLLRAFLLRLQ